LREIAALKPSTVLLLTALSVGMFQSFTVLGKKECLYTAISVVAESICLLLDVLGYIQYYYQRVWLVMYIECIMLVGWFMVFNTNFNNILVISWRSLLLMEESGVPEENHQPVASH